MKKTFIYSILILALAAAPTGVGAETIFNFKATNKAQVTTPAPAVAPTQATNDEVSDEELTVEDIQSQPLPVRRRIVASELADIQLRLDTLTSKTKVAATRLADNGIATDAARDELTKATLALAQAKLSIDTLTLAANDPANETVLEVKIGNNTFKEAVVSVEDTLRSARQSVINALAALKAAVSASVSVQ